MNRNINCTVEEFTIGNTEIKIRDDYCLSKTEAEVKTVLHNVARIAQANLSCDHSDISGAKAQKTDSIKTE